MDELLAVVTRKGQVTIPAEVRKALALKRGDVVVFTRPDSPTGATTLRRAPTARTSVAERLFGSLHSDVAAMNPDQENAAFERAVAAEGDSLPHQSKPPDTDG